MKYDPGFEQVREAAEDQQKATLWQDQLRNGRSIDAFLWKGDPNARPIQRAGLVVFGLTFFLLATIMGSIPFQQKFQDDSGILLLIALFALLLSLRLFRNAFLRPQKHNPRPKENS
jgi:hypothetical protein